MNSNNNVSADDWRRHGQEHFLKGVSLMSSRYYPYNENWEHDHCEFCGKKFSLCTNDLNEGYSTKDGYHWICKECFNDFKDEFDWYIENNNSSPPRPIGSTFI